MKLISPSLHDTRNRQRLTAKVVLHKRQHADGTYQVRIRLTKNRQSAFFDAGFSIFDYNWNPKGSFDQPKWIRKGYGEPDEFNNYLLGLHLRISYLADIYPALSAIEVRDMLMLPLQESLDELQRKAKAALSAPPPPELVVQLKQNQILTNRVDALEKRVKKMEAQLKKHLSA